MSSVWDKLTPEGCNNCKHRIGRLGTPNTDRIICELLGALDGWPHQNYKCESYEPETREFKEVVIKKVGIIPADFILRKEYVRGERE